MRSALCAVVALVLSMLASTGRSGILLAVDDLAVSAAVDPAPGLSLVDSGQRLGNNNQSWDLRLADINGDGAPDAYFEGALWTNDGKGRFSRTTTSFGPADKQAYFADFDRDERVDVVCNGIVLLNDGHHHFIKKGGVPSNIDMASVFLADLNGDGAVDIIAGSQTEDRILLNDGHGSFTNTHRGLGGWGQSTYAVGDINGDGKIDVYVVVPHVPPNGGHTPNLICLGDGRGSFDCRPHEIAHSLTRSVVLADLNHDGSLDLFLSDQGEWGNTSRVFLNDGTGRFVDTGQDLGSRAGDAKAVDLNGDGHLDLVEAGFHLPDAGGPIKVWLNDGHGRFSDSGVRLGAANTFRLEVADLDRDGRPDIIASHVLALPATTVTDVWLNTTGAARSDGTSETGSAGAQDRQVAAAASATSDLLDLGGAPLGEVTEHDAMMLDFHAPRLVDRLKDSGRSIPDGVSGLLAAASAAYKKGDHYKAFRLYARAAGLAHGPERVEAFEVAASLDVSLNRAIFGRGETITLAVRPLFSLGHPLTSAYAAHCWLESRSGILAGSQQTRRLTELALTSFELPTDGLEEGIVAVGYRLDSTAGETLAEFRYAVVIARDAEPRLARLKAGLVALTARGTGTRQAPAVVAAVETLRHHTQALEADRSRFDGPWQRRAHPFGMYWSTVNGRAAGRPAMGFPPFAGPLRYPEDVVLAESLADALVRTSDAPLHPSGDTQQAYLAPDGELVRYRVFVPAGYDATRSYPLIIAIHSGAGPGTYFDWETNLSNERTAPKENQLKRLAQERGYIVVCPSGRGGSFGEFLSPRGEADVLDVLRRVRDVYSVDPERVFLTGWSVGSDAVWHIGVAHPELFRAIAPVAGSAEWLSPDKARNAAHLRVLFSAGASDSSVAAARRTSALAKELLAEFTYVEYPETTHDAVWAKALTAMFDFFDAADAKPEKPTATMSTDQRGEHSGAAGCMRACAAECG